MRRGMIVRRGMIGLGVLVIIGVGGVAAWHFTKPARERHAFVSKCMANTYTQQECSCTYDAYRSLAPPYAVLVKSSVHDTRGDFAINAGKFFGGRLTYAGL